MTLILSDHVKSSAVCLEDEGKLVNQGRTDNTLGGPLVALRVLKNDEQPWQCSHCLFNHLMFIEYKFRNFTVWSLSSILSK